MGARRLSSFRQTMYADTANYNSPAGYELVLYPLNPNPWYVIIGSWSKYALYFQQTRDVTLELSAQKLLNPSQLSAHWDYNYKSLLNYIEQVLYGVRGTVTDSLTGEPLNAKVFVETHDHDSSWVYSHLPHGDYYRPIFEGSYDITFSSEGYIPKTVTGVQVKNNEAVVLDVELVKDVTGIIYKNKTPKLTINVCSSQVKISFNNNLNSYLQLLIFDVSGRLVKTLHSGRGAGNCVITWNGVDNNNSTVSSGCYIVQVKAKGNSYSKNFMFSR